MRAKRLMGGPGRIAKQMLLGALVLCCLMLAFTGLAWALAYQQETDVASSARACVVIATNDQAAADCRGILALEQNANLIASSASALEDEEAITFSVSYDDASAETSGYITYKVKTEPSGDQPGAVLLMDGTHYAATESSPALALNTVTDSATGKNYQVLGINRDAFKGNVSVYAVTVANSLTVASEKKATSDSDTCCAVGPYAFSGCSNLRSITFEGNEVGGIGTWAFANCSSLASVSFADGAQISSEGVQAWAFANCSSLTSMRVPAITSAQRCGDFFESYGTTSRFYSGYQPYWHDAIFCVAKPGLRSEVFVGCTALENITFEAGNQTGMFAYWRSDGCGLRYLTNLKSVVYEAAQPYFGNEDASLGNASFKQVWGDYTDDSGITTKGAEPTFYYAVDYYYTADQAADDDARADKRLARTEYAKGASVTSIENGDASALTTMLADRSLYAQKTEDGTVLDPNDAAREAQAQGWSGFEDADEHKWVWYLQSGESRRVGLTDSCQAYLVRADDLKTGHLEANRDTEDQIESMYRVCTQNLSKNGVQNTLFSPEYKYDTLFGSYFYINESGLQHFDEDKTPWFTLDDGRLDTLVQQVKFYDGQGVELDLTDAKSFSVTYQRYDADAQALVGVDATSVVVPSGPLLMTITPLEGSGYDINTSFKEWILQYGASADVTEMYGDAANVESSDASKTTWYHALYGSGNSALPTESFDTQNSVSLVVSSQDSTSTLLAASFAGVADGSINVRSTDEVYGFRVAGPGQFTDNGVVTNNVSLDNLLSFDRGSYTASEFANLCFDRFLSQMVLLGVKGLSWGDTALLVNPNYVEDSASAAAMYAYNQKAPIFYTESDGVVSSDTVERLQNFKKVVIVGDSGIISDSAKDQIAAALGSGVTVDRVTGLATNDQKLQVSAPGNGSALSLAMANYLMKENSEVKVQDIAIVVASGADMVSDAVSVQNFSGHESGITLTVSSSADAKSVVQYLLENKERKPVIRLYGRSSAAGNSSTFVLYDSLVSIWAGQTKQIADLDQNDLIELYGVLLEADSQHVLSSPTRIWGIDAIDPGVFVGRSTTGDAIAYTLNEQVPRRMYDVDKPEAETGLVYNGGEQTGVRSTSAYRAVNGTATNAGTYTATIVLNDGYQWSDGTTDDLSVSWTIGQKDLSLATITMSNYKSRYSGAAVAPNIVSVKVGDLTLTPSDYDVSYYRDSIAAENQITSMVDAGTYVVAVNGKGNFSGQAGVSYVIESSGSSSASSKSSITITKTGGSGSLASQSSSSNSIRPNPSEDGWYTFAAPGNTSLFSALTGQDTDGSSKDTVTAVVLVLVCLLAVGGAIYFSSRPPKQTDDQITGEACA